MQMFLKLHYQFFLLWEKRGFQRGKIKTNVVKPALLLPESILHPELHVPTFFGNHNKNR